MGPPGPPNEPRGPCGCGGRGGMPPRTGEPTNEPWREPALEGANGTGPVGPPLGIVCGEGPFWGM